VVTSRGIPRGRRRKRSFVRDAVIPRLAKRAEGPRKRSIASAQVMAYSSGNAQFFAETLNATARSLAVGAARDDIWGMRSS
jgi:hypothetical protein